MIYRYLPCVLFALAALAAPHAGAGDRDGLDQFSYRAQDLETLRNQFAAPPRGVAPWVHWFWYDGMLSREEIAREIDELAAAGFGGAEIRCITFHGWGGDPLPQTDDESLARIGHRRVEYLSDEFIDLLAHACAQAKKHSLRLSINLGQGWPPGGPWITNEHRSKLLTVDSLVVTGPERFSRSDLPPQGYVLAWQLRDDRATVDPETLVDLTPTIETVDGRRTLEWQTPPGTWLIGFFEVRPGGLADKGDGPEVDPASREAVLFHLNHLFGRLDPKLQPYYGNVLVDVASDSWEYHHGAGRYWSDALPAAVKERAGYDLRSKMHTLLGYGPDINNVLADLKEAEQHLVHRNFFETVAQFVNPRGLGHRPQVYGRGLSRDFFSAYALADTPEVEHGVILPEAPWAAHLMGKPVVSAEAFTFLSRKYPPVRHHNNLWEATPALLRWHANHYYAEGVNRIQFHSFSYSPPELPPPGWRMYAEIHFNRDVAWWDWTPELTRWMSRNQSILQAGEPVADTLVYPVASNEQESPYHQEFQRQVVSASNGVDAANRQLMQTLIDEGRLDKIHFDNLLFLAAPDASLQAEQLLNALPASGKVLSTVSPDQWRRLAEDRPDSRLAAMLDQLRQTDRYVQVLPDQWRDELRRQTSVRWTPSRGDLRFQHRRIGDADVYFLTNAGEAFDGWVTFPHPAEAVELWDADQGQTARAARLRTDDQTTSVPIRLDHFESTAVSFAPGVAPRHVVDTTAERVVRRGDELLAICKSAGEHRATLSDGATQRWHVELPAPRELPGPWTVAPLAGSDQHRVRHTLESLVPWRHLRGLERYAGKVVYETTFEMPPEMIDDRLQWTLDLGRVYEVARVWVNDQPVGPAWSAPYRVDVTRGLKPGRNTLRVVVANLLKNQLEPGPSYDRPSGLLGPATLAPAHVQQIEPEG